jgi:DNA-directed RNA polymerase subunit M/transcription elongation factor TFIIS
MPLFCQICNNLLSVIATSDEFYFKCISCQSIYQPDEKDSLRYENIKGTNLIIYKTILQNAGRDPVNPKVKKNCTTCKNDIVRQVRLGEDMRLINICTKCGKQWIEGLEKISA